MMVYLKTQDFILIEILIQSWRKLSEDLNIRLKDYRTNGKHIVIALQRNGGWSMRNLPVMDWLKKTIRDIRQFSDRPIVVRGHPGDKKVHIFTT